MPEVIGANRPLAGIVDMSGDGTPVKRAREAKRAAFVLREIDHFETLERGHKENVASGLRGTAAAFSIATMLVPISGAMHISCKAGMNNDDRINCYTNLVGLLGALAGLAIGLHGLQKFCSRRTHLSDNIHPMDEATHREMARRPEGHDTLVSNFFTRYENMRDTQRVAVKDALIGKMNS